MKSLNRQAIVKDILLEKLRDKLSYKEVQRIQERVEIDFIRAKRKHLKRRERYSLIWLVGALVYMVLMAVVWGMTSGWTNIFLTGVEGISVFGVAWTGIVQYLDLQKTMGVWSHAEYLLWRDAAFGQRSDQGEPCFSN